MCSRLCSRDPRQRSKCIVRHRRYRDRSDPKLEQPPASNNFGGHLHPPLATDTTIGDRDIATSGSFISAVGRTPLRPRARAAARSPALGFTYQGWLLHRWRDVIGTRDFSIRSGLRDSRRVHPLLARCRAITGKEPNSTGVSSILLARSDGSPVKTVVLAPHRLRCAPRWRAHGAPRERSTSPRIDILGLTPVASLGPIRRHLCCVRQKIGWACPGLNRRTP